MPTYFAPLIIVWMVGVATLGVYMRMMDPRIYWPAQHVALRSKCDQIRPGKGAVLYLRDGAPLCVDWNAAGIRTLW